MARPEVAADYARFQELDRERAAIEAVVTHIVATTPALPRRAR